MRSDLRPPMRPYYRFMRFLSQAAFILYFRGRMFGRERVPLAGPVVLACNHQSFFDPLCATLGLPREGNYLARDTLFRNPVFRRLIASLNAFPVKRGAADVAAVKEILRRLKEGRLIVIFPEATRTRDGEIGPINANSMAVAQRAGATIVPTVVDGAFEAWPRGQWLPSPRSIHVTYAEPIRPEQARGWTPDQIAETVRDRLVATLVRSRARRRAASRCGTGHAAACLG